MPGRGPAPKPPEKRARRNAAPAQTVLTFEPAEQPQLPEGGHWPNQTREWWQKWREAPQAELFSATDWQFLLDTALLHAAVWGEGDLDKLGELRLRVAKFGATLEDRARLRITFATADEKDAARPTPAKPAAERWGDLRALPAGGA
jgi:hypothetical protein